MPPPKRAELPLSASLAVVSKGDEELLKLKVRRACHFPVDKQGGYAGFYPSNGLSAIAQIETLRSRGFDYLLFPATALWWLDKYPDLKRHLDRRYKLFIHQADTCAIYALRIRTDRARRLDEQRRER